MILALLLSSLFPHLRPCLRPLRSPYCSRGTEGYTNQNPIMRPKGMGRASDQDRAGRTWWMRRIRRGSDERFAQRWRIGIELRRTGMITRGGDGKDVQLMGAILLLERDDGMGDSSGSPGRETSDLLRFLSLTHPSMFSTVHRSSRYLQTYIAIF